MRRGRLSKFIIVAMTSVLFLLSLLFFVSNNEGLSRQLANMPATVLGSVTSVLRQPLDWLTGLQQELDDLFHAHEENQVLKQRLAVLEHQDQELSALKKDNEHLRDRLSIQSSFSAYRLLPARVIYRSTLSWLDFLTLDKGELDQVSTRFFVVTSKGLVGTVNQVNDSTAQVELLTNSLRQQPVAVKVVSGDEVVYAMVLGYDAETSLLTVGQLNRQLAVLPGAKVLTSGLDGTGVEGVLVGTVTAVKRSEDQSVELAVELAVDGSDLSELTLLGEGEDD